MTQEYQEYAPPLDTRPNRGFHPLLEQDHPYVFIDGCVQIWPDADFANAHRHGCTCYAVTGTRPYADCAEALEQLMYWRLIARNYPNLVVVETAEEIRAAKRDGRAALLLASQDGEFIAGKLHRVEAFYRLGLRMMIPAYNRDNLNCGGVLDRTNAGLSAFGRMVVAECNRVGLLLDCSHVSRQASLDIIDASEDPVVFSHANPRRLVDNPRNVDDDQIKACAEKGGVIGTVNWGPLIFREGMTSRPTVDDYLDHIDYLADLLGNTDHIGIGSDFSLGSYPPHSSKKDVWGHPDYADVMADYDKYMPTYQRAPERFADGFSNYTEIVPVIDKMKQRGYSEADVHKLLGGNFLRVFERAWKTPG